MNDMYNEVEKSLKVFMNTFPDNLKYADWVVKILVGPSVVTTVLMFNSSTLSYVWRKDWWEGEKFVRILAAYPLDLVEIPIFGFDFKVDITEVN